MPSALKPAPAVAAMTSWIEAVQRPSGVSASVGRSGIRDAAETRPPGHRDRLARNVGGSVAGQEVDDLGDLDRLAHAAEWRARAQDLGIDPGHLPGGGYAL